MGTRVIAIESPQLSMTLTASATSINAWQTVQLTPAIVGGGNPAVRYTVEPAVGSISSSGVYTPPNPIAAQQVVKITAISLSNESVSAFVNLTLLPVSLSVSPAGPLTAAPGESIAFTPTVSGAPDVTVNWSIVPANGAGTMTGNTYTAPSGVTAPMNVTLTAVSGADPSRSQTIAINVTPGSSLGFGSSSVSVGDAALFGTVGVRAIPGSTSWSITSNAFWLTVSPASGTGNQSVTYSYAGNPLSTPRTGILTLSATGMTPATFAVTQQGRPVSIDINPTTGTYGSRNSGALTIAVTSTADWTASVNQPWIRLTTTGGSAGINQPLTFSLDSNTTTATRNGAITVAAGSVTRAFSITQTRPSTLAITPANVTVTIGTNYQFSALIDGVPDNAGVQWSAGMGTVANGLYTPPTMDATGFPSTTVTASIPALGLSATANVILQNKMLNPAWVVGYSSLAGSSGPGDTFKLRVHDPNGASNLEMFYIRFAQDGYSAPQVAQNENFQCSPAWVYNSLFTFPAKSWQYRFMWGNNAGTQSYLLPTTVTPVTTTCNAYGPGISVEQNNFYEVTGSVPLTFTIPPGNPSFANGPLHAWTHARGYNASLLMEIESGTYTLQPGGPNVTNTNQQGNAGSANLSGVFTHSQGSAALAQAEILVAVTNAFDPFSASRFPNTCNIQYRSAQNLLYLRSDDGLQWLGGITPGTSATVENNQCRINASGAVISKLTTLGVTVPVTFKRSFAGSYALYALAVDRGGLNSGYKQFGYWTVSAATVAMSPLNPTVIPNGTVQFAATVSNASQSVTWSLDPVVGSIDTNGLYRAPATVAAPMTTTVRATSTVDPGASASTTITVAPVNVTLTAAKTTIQPGEAISLTATVTGTSTPNVSWTVSPAVGTLSAATSTGSNTFTASSSVSTSQLVTITATSTVDPTRSASIQVTITPVAVAVSPASVALNGGGSRRFDAVVTGPTNTAVNWTISPLVGTIDSTGLYRAPATVATTQTVTVTATTVATPTKTAQATVTLQPITMSVTPSTGLSLMSGQTQQFAASVTGATTPGVTWSASSGSISATGLYSAPALVGSSQTATITAASVSDPNTKITVSVALRPVAVSVTPISVAMGVSQNQQFQATVSNAPSPGVNWTMSPIAGSLSATGLYTSPASSPTTQFINITAAAKADATKTATARVWVMQQPPSVSSMYPSTGQGSSVTYSLTATDPAGITKLQQMEFVITGNDSATNACYLLYNPNSRALYLMNDAGTALSGGVIGQNAPVSNTQCNLNLSAVTATTSGNSVTLRVPLKFTAAFASATAGRDSVVWASATNISGLTSGMANTGIWRVAAPVTINVTPATKTLTAGVSQQFTASVTGSTNTAVSWRITPDLGIISSSGLYAPPTSIPSARTVTVTATSAADNSAVAQSVVTLNPSTVASRLVNAGGAAYTDTQGMAWAADSGFVGGTAGSTPAAIANTPDQALYRAFRQSPTAMYFQFSASPGLYALTLKFAEPVTTAVVGSRTFKIDVQGAVLMNSFDILQSAGAVNKAVDLNYLLNFSVAGTYRLNFTPIAGQALISAIRLVPTTGTGVAVTLNPTQLTVNAGQSVQLNGQVTGDATSAGLQWSINPAIGSITQAGVYQAPTAVPTSTPAITVTARSIANPNVGANTILYLLMQPPTIGPVVPATGAGRNVTYTATVTNPNGAVSTTSIETVIRDSGQFCRVVYSPASGATAATVGLYDHAASVAAPATSTTPLSVSTCSVTPSTVTMTASGNAATLQLPVTFTPSFVTSPGGALKNVDVGATDASGIFSGYINMGSWTVQ